MAAFNHFLIKMKVTNQFKSCAKFVFEVDVNYLDDKILIIRFIDKPLEYDVRHFFKKDRFKFTKMFSKLRSFSNRYFKLSPEALD